jgi:hypothetical protein
MYEKKKRRGRGLNVPPARGGRQLHVDGRFRRFDLDGGRRGRHHRNRRLLCKSEKKTTTLVLRMFRCGNAGCCKCSRAIMPLHHIQGIYEMHVEVS